jgi:hypothetical protein
MPGTYQKIATNTLGSAVSSVTFSSISGAYTDLILVVNANSASLVNLEMQYNGDTGNNYSRTVISGNGSAAQSLRQNNVGYIRLTTEGILGSGQSNQIIQIQNYSNTTTYKTSLNRANNSVYGTDAVVGLWRNTAAITSVTLYVGTFSVGSTFNLYGIKAA